MGKYNYNGLMSNKFDDYLSDPKPFELSDIKHLSRQQINEHMLDIHNDIEYLMDCYAPPKLIRYHHELLSKLIRNYGH